MKKIFLVALAAIGMTACMQDEVVEIANGGAIAFDNAFVGNATRAESVTTANLDAFKVWGYVGNPSGVVFNGTLVEEENGLWTYDETQYWMPKNAYWFAAVAPVLDEGAAASWELTMENAQAPRILALTTDGKTDLVYAHKEVEAADMYGQVAFQFEHLLSKVKLSFTQNLPEYNVAYIENLVVETVKTATIDLNDKVWTPTPGTETLPLVNAELPTYETEDYFIVPAECKVSFDVVVKISGVEVYNQRKTATIPADAFEMGHAYNLSAEINPNTLALNEIEFSADVTDWVEVPNTEEEVNEAADLIYAAQIGGTYTLTNDVTVNAPVVVKEGVNFVLDLNGKTITAELKQEGRHHYAIDNYGTLTLKNGTINARGVENFGTMVIEEGVTITNVDTNAGSAIWNEGDLVINGGTFTTNAEAGEGSYGTALNTQKGGKAVINGGNFVANSQLSYAILNYGETVINNATVVGKHGAVGASEGAEIKTVINGGSFSLVENPNVSDHCVYYVSEIKGGTFTLGNNTDCGAQVFCESTIAKGYKKVEANGVWTVSLDTVADTAELQAALADDSKASIYLAPGATFEGTFTVKRNVEIVSDPNNKAKIVGRVNVVNASPVFSNVTFDRNDTDSNAEWNKANGSSNCLQYKAVVMIYGDMNCKTVFEKCSFYNNNGTHKSAITNTSCELIIDECYFEGRSSAIYTQANVSMTNSIINYTGTNNVVLSVNGCGDAGGKVIFKGNKSEGQNIYAIGQFLSTTAFGNGTYYFDIQNNNDAFDNDFFNTSRVTNKEFAPGSLTF